MKSVDCNDNDGKNAYNNIINNHYSSRSDILAVDITQDNDSDADDNEHENKNQCNRYDEETTNAIDMIKKCRIMSTKTRTNAIDMMKKQPMQ